MTPGHKLLPVKLALLEWYRKSELSADRAGLLASQDTRTAMRVFLKLAGGSGIPVPVPLATGPNGSRLTVNGMPPPACRLIVELLGGFWMTLNVTLPKFRS